MPSERITQPDDTVLHTHTHTGVYYILQVAVKVIDKKKAREDAYVCRNMRRESRLLQQIRHRHIIQLFEVRVLYSFLYLF